MTKPVCRKKSPSKEFFASHHNKSCSCSNRSIQFYESLFLIHCQSCGHISFILFVKYHSTYCTTTLFYFFHQIFLKNLGHFRLELSFHICLLLVMCEPQVFGLRADSSLPFFEISGFRRVRVVQNLLRAGGYLCTYKNLKF